MLTCYRQRRVGERPAAGTMPSFLDQIVPVLSSSLAKQFWLLGIFGVHRFMVLPSFLRDERGTAMAPLVVGRESSLAVESILRHGRYKAERCACFCVDHFVETPPVLRACFLQKIGAKSPPPPCFSYVAQVFRRPVLGFFQLSVTAFTSRAYSRCLLASVFAGETFGVAPLTWDDWTWVLRFSLPILLVEEILKVRKGGSSCAKRLLEVLTLLCAFSCGACSRRHPKP